MNRYSADLQHRMLDAGSDIATHLPILVDRAVQLEAREIVELGCRRGNSTTAWLYALEHLHARDFIPGRLTTVDLDSAPRLRRPSPGIDWRHLKGDDLDEAIVDQVPRRIDLLFVDTSHEYQRTLDELTTYGGRVRPGGLIVLHDTEMVQPGWPYPDDVPWPVRSAAADWADQTRLVEGWVDLDWGYGLGLLKLRA